MKAAVFHGPLKLQVEEVQTPACPPDGVRVRVLAAAVCGTDVKTFFRGHPLFQPPVILGHEFVGEVVEVGGEAKGAGLQVGDRVAAAPYVGCGECRICRNGRGQLCPQRVSVSNGAFAEYVVIPFPIASRATARIGGAEMALSWPALLRYTLTEPLACVLNSLEACRLRRGDALLVVGAGPMGLLHVVAARMEGVAPVVVTDIRAERLRLAEGMGAVAVTASSEGSEWSQAVLDATGGEGLDAAVLAVEAPDLVPGLLRLIRPGGMVNLFAGMPRGARLSVDPFDIHYREVGLVGTFGFKDHHFRRAAAAVGELGDQLDPLLQESVSLDNLPEAMGRMRDHRVLKAVVTWARSSSEDLSA